MSTDPAAPVTPPPTATSVDGRTLTLGEFDADIGAHAYTDPSGKPFVPLAVVKALREKAKALEAKATDPEALKPIRDQIRQELEAQYAPRIIEAQLDGALYRHGFADDPETREEVLSRYGQVKPDAEGKRPSLTEWLKAQREANEGQGARWLRSYLRDDAPPPAKVSAGKDAAPPPAAKPPAPAKPPPVSDPNGGASRTGAPPATGSMSHEIFAALPAAERIRRLPEYEAWARQAGKIR